MAPSIKCRRWKQNYQLTLPSNTSKRCTLSEECGIYSRITWYNLIIYTIQTLRFYLSKIRETLEPLNYIILSQTIYNNCCQWFKKKGFQVNAALNKCCGVKLNKYGTPQIKSRQLPSSNMFSLVLHLFHSDLFRNSAISCSESHKHHWYFLVGK